MPYWLSMSWALRRLRTTLYQQVINDQLSEWHWWNWKWGWWPVLHWDKTTFNCSIISCHQLTTKMNTLHTCRNVNGSYATEGRIDCATCMDPECGENSVAGLSEASAARYIMGQFTCCLLNTFIFPFHCTLSMYSLRCARCGCNGLAFTWPGPQAPKSK